MIKLKPLLPFTNITRQLQTIKVDDIIENKTNKRIYLCFRNKHIYRAFKTFCHSHQIRTHTASNSRNCLNSEKDDNDLFALRCTINSQNLEKLMNLTDLSSLDYSGKELNNFFLLLYLKCLTTNHYKLYNQNTLSFFDWQIFAVKINDKLYLLSKPTNEDSLFGPYQLHIENPIDPTNFKDHVKFQQLGDPLPLNSLVDNFDKLQDDYQKIENSINNTKTWLATNYWCSFPFFL